MLQKDKQAALDSSEGKLRDFDDFSQRHAQMSPLYENAAYFLQDG